MNVTAKINGHIQLGGGLSSYVAYKIDISYEGKQWCVYRRFRDFCILHEKLLKDYGKEALEAIPLVLPDHLLPMGKTLNYVTNKRSAALQAYLEKVWALEDITSHDYIFEFLDTADNGKSGALKEIGAKGILLENFGCCKPCTKPMELWHHVYLVLTKAGSLYIFKNYDDGVFQAFVNFPIAERAVHVVSRQGSRSIDISCTDEGAPLRVILNLPTDMLVASWLRYIADFSTRGTNDFTPRPSGWGTTPEPSPAKAASKPIQKSAAESEVVIKAKGTGATGDDLSAMYGV